MGANLGKPVQETGAEDKKRIQELENKIINLENSYDVLSRKYKTKCTENGELRREMKSSEDKLQTQLRNEKKMLCKKIKDLTDKLDAANELKDAAYKKLQRQVCDRNCVSVTIPWICEKKLKSEKFSGCESQLNKLLTHYAGKIDKEDLECEKFMQILTKCEIVDLIHEDDKNDRRTIIRETWEKLMSVNEGVCLLGIKNPSTKGGGHCIICDLDTKTMGGVMLHDLQRDEEEKMSEKEFTQYLDDPDVKGLNLHVVNLEKLEEIINDHRGVLHVRKTTTQIAL